MLSWYTPNYGVADGYGSSAEHMMLGLEKLGYDVRIQPNFVLSGQTHIKHLLPPDKPYANGAVRIAYTPPHPLSWTRRHAQQAVLGFSMWEDTSLPRTYDDAFFGVEAVAAPSDFCVKIFEDRLADLGIERAVHKVPLGVDVDYLPFKHRTFDRDRDLFVVVHSASRSSEIRKGADVAYEAFRKAFPGNENVRLIFRSRLRSFMPESGGDPRVQFHSGSITDEERAEIFHGAHVMLYPSRGEGFGLIPLEALATGMPAIVSDGSSLTDYRDLFYPIETKPVPSKISVAWREIPDGLWHEPSVASAAAHLRWVYENYEQAANKAAESARLIRVRWTYDRTARALTVAIEDARHVRKQHGDVEDERMAEARKRHAVAYNI